MEDFKVGDKVRLVKDGTAMTITKAGKDAKGRLKRVECLHDKSKSVQEYWVDEVVRG